MQRAVQLPFEWLDPAFSPAPAKGLPAMAATAAELQQRHQAAFFELASRSLLNRCDVPRLGFEWSINPYRGCEFGCRYCYARDTHDYFELRDPDDFERHIFVKTPAANRLRSELRRLAPGASIAIGTATDPYQPAERRFLRTRGIWQGLLEFRGLKLNLITKSDLVCRDRELLQEVARRHELRIRITITTLDAALARRLEPRAPRPDLRLAALRELRGAGLAAGIICAPVMPGINDAPAELEALARAAAAHGAVRFGMRILYLRPGPRRVFFQFLDDNFPELKPEYERLFARSAFLPAEHQRRLDRLAAGWRGWFQAPPNTSPPPSERAAP